MRALGRLPSFTPAGVILRSVYIFAWVTAAAPSDYGVPIEIKLWDTGRTPLAHMVDVTNMFGLKVLAEHNFLNDNNIAFSPYGLMGIMVALYEGVDGESSYQIQRGMQLPWNRNVMRVGFRDIHRTLKTYFVPEEGFLAGLALNNENVTFNEPYKKKLRFYGFDLENDQLPTLAPETNNTTNDTNTSAAPTSPTELADSTAATVAMTSAPTREETTMTTNPNAETISTLDIRGGSTTAGSSLSPNAESTPMPSSVITTDETSEKTTETTTQRTAAPASSAAEQTAATTATRSTPADEEAVSLTSQVDSESTTNNEVDTSSVDTSTVQTTTIEPTTAQPTVDMTTSTEAGTDTTPTPSTTLQPTTESAIITSTVTTESTPTEIVMSTTPETPTEQISTMNIGDMTTETNTVTPANDSTLETLERKKKSIVDFIFTNPPYVDDYLYYRSYDIGSDAANPGFDDKMFLANGLRSVQVTYMRYDTVLEYAYLPHLEASALRLPLDSERYYLLVVLPARGGAPELGRLLARMARESDLADIYSVLRPRRVKAIVPSFIVKGHVTLTTDLQKLGIRDVFEPRQRDFTPMTRQPGVYVRSIEQAVSVAIRKYRPDDQKKNRYVTTREPVLFSATYPFLYFVMDANIHVALMAGKMVDPLNSRIL